MKSIATFFLLCQCLFARAEQQNVVVILTDDQGWGDLSLNGNNDLSTPNIDSLAMGSDVARSRRQFLARKLASVVVGALGLNRAGFLATEIAQQVNPVCTIPTAFGQIHCKGGHGRLRWRALTFYTEEPETIKWLDGMKKDDLFWDIGANVGLYSIYAAKSSGCRVLAVEPEAQNYALLLENILLKLERSN